MRLRFRDETIPYPLMALRGRLRLSGLSYLEVEKVVAELQTRIRSRQSVTTQEEVDEIGYSLLEEDSELKRHIEDFNTLARYEKIRRENPEIPPLVLVLEGASATGKSMLAIEMIANLTATRTVSTDTVRQVLRVIYGEEDHPELHCHTYQAYKFKQSGSEEESKVVRGFLAQCDIITPYIIGAVDRILAEGTIALVEGVHLIPGALQGLGRSVLEVLINPDFTTHLSMFKAKHCASGLKTVTDNEQVREEEFRAAREIQDYMLRAAQGSSIAIIGLVSYEETIEALRKTIIEKIVKILHDHRE
ncbi:MAG: hypothetical protein EAX95_07750 [Candidatus Thorarchaeota archaeon]|nr:hypothetical protein [Candidatus Thorarchaeota archaeon]